MNVRDLITELEKFPDLATVFIDTDERGICRLDSTQEIWVKEERVNTDHTRLVELAGTADANDAVDYGVLIIG